MKAIYLDNAATTMIDAEVLSVMHAASLENYGNPSSTHQFGRKAKQLLKMFEKILQDISMLLQAKLFSLQEVLKLII